MNRTLRANLLLLLTAFIWGVSFVAQDVALNSLPPLAFNGIRMAVAGLVMLPCISFLDRRNRASVPSSEKSEPARPSKAARRPLFIGGLCCGIALFGGTGLQVLGIRESTPGKAGFITTLYIVLVPLTGLLRRRRIRPSLWLAVALSVAGLSLLCLTDTLTVGMGDQYLLLGALCFAAHI
ncbi:MAG: DMT family transporter, partial [Clostridia bacterium]|nr:DMT family transporter [Clostridia bacterium]